MSEVDTIELVNTIWSVASMDQDQSKPTTVEEKVSPPGNNSAGFTNQYSTILPLHACIPPHQKVGGEAFLGFN